MLQVGAINAAMSSLVKCLNVFPKERLIVQRERSKSSYGVAPYFFAKLAAESPIGAAFPLLFASIVYPTSRLHPKLSRCTLTHSIQPYLCMANNWTCHMVNVGRYWPAAPRRKWPSHATACPGVRHHHHV